MPDESTEISDEFLTRVFEAKVADTFRGIKAMNRIVDRKSELETGLGVEHEAAFSELGVRATGSICLLQQALEATFAPPAIKKRWPVLDELNDQFHQALGGFADSEEHCVRLSREMAEQAQDRMRGAEPVMDAQVAWLLNSYLTTG